MASFFALNIAQFPKDPATGENSWQLAKVSGYLCKFWNQRSLFPVM